jgi:hypothetical protein
MNSDQRGCEVRARIQQEHGSVLLLGIGLMAVVLVAISVATDASMAFLQRQELQARADAAVLSGVQAIDRDHYYAHGATEHTRLLPTAAHARTRGHIERQQARDPIPGLRILDVGGNERAITAELAAPVRTAFWPVAASISVRSTASLDYVG